MKLKRHAATWLWLTLLPVLLRAEAPSVPRTFAGATPLDWSARLARDEIARRGDSLDYGVGHARWDYTTGLFDLALLRLAARRGDAALAQRAEETIGSFVAPDGEIRTYRAADFNLDMILSGRALLLLWDRTHDERYRRAAERLRAQLATQPRTSEGGFWHKQRYPDQMWLDGLYMAGPFYAEYAARFGEPAVFDDVARQLLLVGQHTYDARTGLFHHAWDAAHRQAWADPTTGISPAAWSRSEGWYAMALVDVLDQLPGTHPEADAVAGMLRKLADGLVRWQDPATGLWWQVLDQGAQPGNYLEASASSMFVYALARGVNRGYLPRTFAAAAEKGYTGLIRDLVKTDAAGRVSLTQICEVGGLGSTSASGRARDGTFDYYVSEPVVANDLKGVGPFILAGLEMEQLRMEPAAARSTARGWDLAAEIVARIRAPEFPAKDFPITDYGAVPGDAADCTAALRQAIAACHAAGGGQVRVPAGVWRTGAIHLLSRVNLHLEAGATLRFSAAPADYLPVVFTRWEGTECMNYSALISAFEQEDIAVTGAGVLDGSAGADNWWTWKSGPQAAAARARLHEMGERGVPVAERVFGAGGFLRPNFIQPYRCRNVLIEGVTIIRSPMWGVNPVLCTNVTVRGVHVDSHGPNNDGCDPESCRDVLVERCVFDTGDDCIAIKSGRDGDGRRIGVPAENIVVRDCAMRDGHAGVALGSEISGGARNIIVERCTMDSPNLDRALRIKSNARRGGTVEHVLLRQVKVGRVAEAVLTIDLLYEEGARGDHPPVVRDVRLEEVTSMASPRVLWIAGFPGATIDGVRLSDCQFRGLTDADVVRDAGAIEFDHVLIEPAGGNSRSRSSRPPPPDSPRP